MNIQEQPARQTGPSYTVYQMGGCPTPSQGEVCASIKEIISGALGMMAVFALTKAVKATFDEYGPAALLTYAVTATLVACLFVGFMRNWLAPRLGGTRAEAMKDLTRLAMAFVAGDAWEAYLDVDADRKRDLLMYACLYTLLAIVILLLVIQLHNSWANGKICQTSIPCLARIVEYTIVGAVLIAPVTLGVIAGGIWNAYAEAMMDDQLGGGSKMRLAFLKAIVTTILAIVVVLFVERVAQRGFGFGSCQCPWFLGQPCFSLPGNVAAPLKTMFIGEASVLMAFAWNLAFDLFFGDFAGNSEILYAVVAVIFGVVVVIFFKRLRNLRGGEATDMCWNNDVKATLAELLTFTAIIIVAFALDKAVSASWKRHCVGQGLSVCRGLRFLWTYAGIAIALAVLVTLVLGESLKFGEDMCA